MPLGDRLAQHLLGLRLDRVVERRVKVGAFPDGARLDDVDRRARTGRRTFVCMPGLPASWWLYCELEAAEALVVGPGEPDDLRADGALRVRALLLRVGADAGEVLLQELGGLGGVGEALDVDEVRLLVQQLRVERVRVDAEQLSGRERDGARLTQLGRVGVDGRRLLADRELGARPVEDRARAPPGR